MKRSAGHRGLQWVGLVTVYDGIQGRLQSISSWEQSDEREKPVVTILS